MENDIKFVKAKERFAKEVKSLRKMDEIVNEFIRRRKSFEKYYPEIKDFKGYLFTFKPNMVSSRQEKAFSLYNYEVEKRDNSNYDGHITNYKAPGFLGVDDKTFKKILSLGLIVPTGYTSFRKWGKNLETPYFDYDYLYKIRNEKLQEFIIKAGGFDSGEDKLRWDDIVDEMESKYSLKLRNRSWYRVVLLKSINCEVFGLINIGLNIKNFKSVDLDSIRNKLESYRSKFKEMDDTLNKRADLVLERSFITETELKMIYGIENGLNQDDLFKELDFKVKQVLYKRNLIKTEDKLDLKNYQNSFKLAREMKRKINFVVGPTNSGKTFQALEALIEADTGLYLAPLRLMALEAYERLNEAGIPCNLVTGEESILVPNAKHTSSTIECLNLDKQVDCAIIDEIQMIADPERGWAWTNALLGAPAKEVFVIGNTSALCKSVEIIERVGDDYEVLHKERLSTLNTINPISFSDLKKGDALIAFSKKQVLRYAIKLREEGKKVSVIYGALSPEVRKKQAKLFSTGENDILVSTDAIGMGLNLPLDRVIFSSLEKYDGKENRALNHTEVKQIGGRAGRFNSDGKVGMLDTCGLNSNFIDNNLAVVEESINKFPISANKWHVSIIKDILKTDSIEEILKVFPDLCNSDDFYSLDNKTILYIANFIDGKLDIRAEDKLKFCFTPIDIKSDRQVGFFYYIISVAFKSKNEIRFPKYDSFNKIGTFEDLAKAEEELKMMTIFKYLSKYSAYINLDGIDDRKKHLEEFIFKTLLKVKLPEVYVNDYYEDLYGDGYFY